MNALNTDGTLWSIGYDANGVNWRGVTGDITTFVKAQGTDWTDIATDYYSSQGLKDDGTRWGSGANNKTAHHLGLKQPTADKILSNGKTGPFQQVPCFTCKQSRADT